MINNLTKYLRKNFLAIFLFHGVTDINPYKIRNYTRKHIDATLFKHLLEELGRKGTPVSMEDIINIHISGKSYPSYSFAITFDDGFANNYTIAAPILEKLGIPATIYVTTGWVEVNGMSWIDQIEQCFEETSHGEIKLPWRKELVPFCSSKEKIALLDEMRLQIKKNRNININSFVKNICEQCGRKVLSNNDGPLDKKLTWAQIIELHRHPLFTIGGHSHSHAIMSYLNDKELAFEIDTSINLLSEKAGITPRHYSYPEGTSFSYDSRVIEQLRKRGVICCPTVLQEVNDGTESLMELKRILVS